MTEAFARRMKKNYQNAEKIKYGLCYVPDTLSRKTSLIGPKVIDGQLVPPGKACLLLTDHLITG